MGERSEKLERLIADAKARHGDAVRVLKKGGQKGQVGTIHHAQSGGYQVQFGHDKRTLPYRGKELEAAAATSDTLS